jgi:hypothetical protein
MITFCTKRKQTYANYCKIVYLTMIITKQVQLKKLDTSIPLDVVFFT